MHLNTHDEFRRAADTLVDPTKPNRRHLFRRLVSILGHHHHAEEVGLFPIVRRHTNQCLDGLIDDHAALDAVCERVADGFARGTPDEPLRAFRQALFDHLDREEALVIPVLLDLAPEDWSG